ncbi:MAG: PIN domain-containing protein [Nanoarchaeota archaeon]|nr:PIN domain-containing protein [Nanoarchaeota archaeon]MBU4116766.1 PIN domain-containing protein [Nanoarchaeota archaeon]
MSYFYDTYAIISLIEGDKNYDKYKKNIITTNLLNLAEIYNIFLRTHGKQTASYWIKKLNFNLLELDEDSLFKAVEFRFYNKKENLSLTNCIGYILALKNNMTFLTGDEKFENKKNVEFVKK